MSVWSVTLAPKGGADMGGARRGGDGAERGSAGQAGPGGVTSVPHTLPASLYSDLLYLSNPGTTETTLGGQGLNQQG